MTNKKVPSYYYGGQIAFPSRLKFGPAEAELVVRDALNFPDLKRAVRERLKAALQDLQDPESVEQPSNEMLWGPCLT